MARRGWFVRAVGLECARLWIMDNEAVDEDAMRCGAVQDGPKNPEVGHIRGKRLGAPLQQPGEKGQGWAGARKRPANQLT